jgi:hypothetical protein
MKKDSDKITSMISNGADGRDRTVGIQVNEHDGRVTAAPYGLRHEHSGGGRAGSVHRAGRDFRDAGRAGGLPGPSYLRRSHMSAAARRGRGGHDGALRHAAGVAVTQSVMGCGASVGAAMGARTVRVGDPVQLRGRAKGSEVLRAGEAGQAVEITVGGSVKVQGARQRERWVAESDLCVTAPPGLTRMGRAKWWWDRVRPKQSAGAHGEEPAGAQLFEGAEDGDDGGELAAAAISLTHWDLLSPHVPVVGLHHLAARSQSLGGAWVGDARGAVVVAEIDGATEMCEAAMAQYGDAGAARLSKLTGVLYAKLVECTRVHASGSVAHIYGPRLVMTFCSTPRPPISGGGSTLPPSGCRIVVTVVRAAALERADIVRPF